MIKYKCPNIECGKLLEYLEYQTNGYSYGTFYIEGQDHQCDGDEFDGETNYNCPECGEEINDPDQLEKVEIDEDDNPINEENTRTQEKRIKPIITEEIYEQTRPWKNNIQIMYVECKKCKTKVEIIDDEEFNSYINCTKCKTEIKTDEDKIIYSNEKRII